MKKRDLSDDEKELWKEFSRSTKPLSHQTKKIHQRTPEIKKRINTVDLKDQEQYVMGAQKTSAHLKKTPALPSLSMDYKLHTKMRQGKIRPEAKLDLYGLNLAQAQPTLTKFILDFPSVIKSSTSKLFFPLKISPSISLFLPYFFGCFLT